MRIGMITVELCQKGLPTGRAFLTKNRSTALRGISVQDYKCFKVMQLYLDRKPEVVDEWPNHRVRDFEDIGQYSSGTSEWPR